VAQAGTAADATEAALPIRVSADRSPFDKHMETRCNQVKKSA
jgi:hypothetical protein